MTNMAILGFGVVGSGVYEATVDNCDIIKRKCGEIKVKRILDVLDFSAHAAGHLFAKNFEEILDDDEISIVVESIGGLKHAYPYTKAALERGKHVVTSNKELVATHGAELRKIAAEKGVQYLFEASVGGGTPIIRPLKTCLAVNRITEIVGILNGTTNYILAKMSKDGLSFADALKKAQENGYAESDPSADVDGIDTCRKIAILASLAFDQDISCDDIPVKGITGITADDIKKAAESDSVWKLVGQAKEVDGKVQCKVEPTLIPKTNLLASVNDVFNGIIVRGTPIDEVMFYGRGAGKHPTASAVMSDVMDIAGL